MFKEPDDEVTLKKKMLFDSNVTLNAYVLDSSCLSLEDTNYNKITKQPASVIKKVVVDICKPLSELKRKLEQKLYKSLSGYVFVLFDSHTMHDYTRLLTGPLETKEFRLVTVQIWGHSKTINILEMKKDNNTCHSGEQDMSSSTLYNLLTLDDVSKLPPDPKEWDRSHVHYWVHQICRHIGTQDINNILITGKQLLTEDKAHFQNILPQNYVDIFWKHIILLRVSNVIEQNVQLENQEPTTSVGMKRDYFRNWLVAFDFQKIQIKNKIPDDPENWNLEQISYWLEWASCRFNVEAFNYLLGVTSGKELVKLTRKKFLEMMPDDPSDVFWVHLQLLVKTKIVAAVQEENYDIPVKANPRGSTSSTI